MALTTEQKNTVFAAVDAMRILMEAADGACEYLEKNVEETYLRELVRKALSDASFKASEVRKTLNQLRD